MKDQENKNKQQRKAGKPKGRFSRMKPGRDLLSTIANVLFIFLIILAIFSLFAEKPSETREVTLSELAGEIKEGRVEKISIEGEKLSVTYRKLENATSSVMGISKKEAESSITETLGNYGVTPEMLQAVNVEVSEWRRIDAKVY
mgnify:CR=1 FL=1